MNETSRCAMSAPRSRHRPDVDSRDDEDFEEPPILKKGGKQYIYIYIYV